MLELISKNAAIVKRIADEIGVRDRQAIETLGLLEEG